VIAVSSPLRFGVPTCIPVPAFLDPRNATLPVLEAYDRSFETEPLNAAPLDASRRRVRDAAGPDKS